MFKVNWYLYSVCIVNFEHVIVGWVMLNKILYEA